MTIDVIIAAYNARETIGRSLKSALRQPDVSQVIIVDDASKDDTVEIARIAGGNDPRVRLLRQQKNAGPSAARNRAITESRAPFIAILDADDIVLEGRFQTLLAHKDWDFIADNIVFCSTFDELDTPGVPGPTTATGSCSMDFAGFVAGNVPVRGRPRGELGFLKPIIHRDFLDRHALSYDENCRLGEDFILYASALANGARFKLLQRCGYAALLRGDSLSSGHGLEELQALHLKSVEIGERFDLSSDMQASLDLHLKSLKRRIDHRHVLHKRQTRGLLSGVSSAARHPQTIFDILNDRFGNNPKPRPTPRLLLDELWFEANAGRMD